MRSNPGDTRSTSDSSASNGSSASNTPLDTSGFLILFTKVAGGLLALGLAAILVYSLQDIDHFLSISTTAILLAAAALVLGLLAGFIFGIPTSRRDETPGNQPGTPGGGLGEPGQTDDVPSAQPYRPNTNLEKISDWLGTILVGIGLTQLLKLPAALDAFGTRLRPALGDTEAAGWVAIGVLILYTVVGFLIGFMWTRVKIPELYALSDFRQNVLYAVNKGKEAGRAEGKSEGLSEGVSQGERNAVEAMASVQGESASGDLVPKGLSFGLPTEGTEAKQILWVDNQPDNNKGLRQLIAGKMNASFETCLSTRDALDKLSGPYDLIISDMSRPEGRLAGFDLLKELRKQGKQTPYLIYAGKVSPGQEEETRRLGGQGITASPIQLMNMVERALKS